MKNWFTRPFLFLIAAVILAASFGIYQAVKHGNSRQPEVPMYGKVQPFSFVDQSGKGMRLQDLAGKVWIANFIFTRCAGPCPMMSARMKDLTEKFGDGRLRFVSFSVDPEYDTPEVLTKYAEKFPDESGRWLFLTGRKNEVYRVAQESFLLGASHSGKQDPGQAIMHSTKFVLVDGRAQIRGYYDSTEKDSLERLADDTKRLLESLDA